MKHRTWLGVAVLALAACSSGNGGSSESRPTPVDPTGESPDDPGARPPATAPVANAPAAGPPDAAATAAPDGLERARERARAALAAQRPDATIEVGVTDGPAGTRIVRARLSKSYPGTGVAALIYDPDSGQSYGKHGELPLARLVQGRGWLSDRLPDADLIELVHQAQFNGVLALRDPLVEAADGGLRVRLPAYSRRGELRRTWLVTLPETGDETVSKAPR